MTELEIIFDCCNQILKKLIILYENSEINEIEFRENSVKKIQFLFNHIHKVNDKSIEKDTLQLLNHFKNLQI